MPVRSSWSAPSKSIAIVAFVVLLAVSPSTSAAPVPPIAELPGPIVIAGGKDVPEDIVKAFFDLAGKDKAKIVVVPPAIATADEAETVEEALKLWQDLEPASVVSLHTRDRKKADDPAFVNPLTEATAVWFANGHTDRLLNAYRGTMFEKEVKKLYARGGVIGPAGGGSSAM